MCFLIFNKTFQSNFSVKRRNDGSFDLANELDWAHLFSMKSCDQCLEEMDTLFRVRISASKEWIFVCRGCLEVVRPNNPNYQYGGTWKNRKNKKWTLMEPKITDSRSVSALVISHFLSYHRHRINQGENIFQRHIAWFQLYSTIFAQ